MCFHKWKYYRRAQVLEHRYRVCEKCGIAQSKENGKWISENPFTGEPICRTNQWILEDIVDLKEIK